MWTEDVTESPTSPSLPLLYGEKGERWSLTLQQVAATQASCAGWRFRTTDSAGAAFSCLATGAQWARQDPAGAATPMQLVNTTGLGRKESTSTTQQAQKRDNQL
ncbi:hypothetical protein CRENBAI_025904 [Crenichthys baileyi]|uniref:Uncharacterized protein n=1 Tax=Crenichthys baileyi TaxID=28760 RepID=A0AAV9S635_9TELE